MFHEMIRGAFTCTVQCFSPEFAEQIEAIKVHHFGPGCHEVLDKLLLAVCASIDLGQCPELGVRTEDEIDTRAGPPDFASLAIAALEHVSVFRYRLPLRAHVEQVYKEVVGERFRASS